jgi:hypothetical protein
VARSFNWPAIAFLLVSAPAACGTLDDGNASARPHVEVFKPSGLKQCSEETPAPETGASLLESNGAKVFASGCASERSMRAQMCGLDRGLVYVYEIERVALAKAQSLGFSDGNEATFQQRYRKIPCR